MEKENFGEKRKLDGSGDWDHLISMPQARMVEFDPEVRRLTEEDKAILADIISGSKKYKAQSIIVGVLLSFLVLLLSFIGFIFSVAGEWITEDTVAVVSIIIIIIWCMATYFAFRLTSRRYKIWIRKLEYKQVVMFISTEIDLSPVAPGVPNPSKEIHVWEYISGVPEKRTYNVHNNTYLQKNTKEGDLIYMYSNKLDGGKYSSGFFVSK